MVMTVAGCSGGPPTEPPHGEVPTIRSGKDVAALALPLDPYSDNLAFVDLLERASDHLVQRCMQRYGLTWPRYIPAADAARPEHLRRWGIADPDEAARFGYLPAELIASRGQRPPTPPPISPDAESVALGRVGEFRGVVVPEGGCFGAANRHLNGTSEGQTMEDVGLGRRLANESYEYTLEDSQVKDLFKRWSTCMRKAGYHYDKPFDASGDKAWTRTDQELRPTSRERETAMADVACRLEINLVGNWYAIEVAYQSRALEAHRAALEKESERLRATERRARQVLDRS